MILVLWAMGIFIVYYLLRASVYATWPVDVQLREEEKEARRRIRSDREEGSKREENMGSRNSGEGRRNYECKHIHQSKRIG